MVDVFIPVIVNNSYKTPGALYSALTQTYQDIRVVLFFDHEHEGLEEFADKWWYTAADKPRSNLIISPYHGVPKPLTIEYCTRGVLVRNPNGPMGSAGFARQWVFEWAGKSEFVKFLDSDDVMTPECLHYMMEKVTADCAGVICPVLFVAACRVGEVLGAGGGSGSFMFKKETMEKIVADGFKWERASGHDRSFTDYLRENQQKYVFNKVTQSALYLYLKS